MDEWGDGSGLGAVAVVLVERVQPNQEPFAVAAATAPTVVEKVVAGTYADDRSKLYDDGG